MNTSSQLLRPGRTYYSPQVRILRLGALKDQDQAEKEFVAERFDVLSVEVTRVNTGSSHYSLTLNNPDTPAPGGRKDKAGRLGPSGDRSRHHDFKYNDFQTFAFGNRLRIDMRYWPDLPDQSAARTTANVWIPMIAGPITDMTFTFSASAGAQLVITGEDDLYPLKNKNPGKVTYKDKTEEFIIRDVLRERAHYPLELSEPRTPWPSFFTERSKGTSETLQEGQSYLEYLQKIAKRCDCEVFVEFDNLFAKSPKPAFHFEPARSRIPAPTGGEATPVAGVHLLERGRNLIEFAPTLKVFEQYTGVTVKGRHRIRSRPQPVKGDAKPDILADELHADEAGGEPPLRPGPEVRQKYFGETFGPNEYPLPNQPNLDEERAKEMARAILRQKAREFLTINGSTIGLPQLRPGSYVQIAGMRPPFDGFYYVEKTVTRYGEGGLTTRFSARRPGIPLPPYRRD